MRFLFRFLLIAICCWLIPCFCCDVPVACPLLCLMLVLRGRKSSTSGADVVRQSVTMNRHRGTQTRLGGCLHIGAHSSCQPVQASPFASAAWHAALLSAPPPAARAFAGAPVSRQDPATISVPETVNSKLAGACHKHNPASHLRGNIRTSAVQATRGHLCCCELCLPLVLFIYPL